MFFNKKPLIVQKFGGTSLASIAHISQVAAIVEKESHEKRLVIVVSAMAGATNESIAKCLEVNIGKSPLGQEAYDSAISSSENLSAALLTLALINRGIFAKTLQGWQIPILTDDNFSKARIIKIDHDKILQYLDKDVVPVICGFQGVTKNNAITTLGRGGSDTTAVAVAAAIKADCCEIYTDVSGVFSADPRLVPKALKIDAISYEEMLCFSLYGAKVLERRSVEIAMRYNISLKVIETNSGKSGTNVTQKQIKASMESSEIKGITLKNDIIFYQIHTQTQKDLYNLLKKFTNVACFNLSVNYNENKCTFESPLSESNKINSIIENKELVSHYVADTQSALVAIVGWSIGENCNLLAKVWKELDQNQVKIQKITSDTHCIKIKVSLNQADAIVKQLHKALLEKQ
jgi:aspartate kinase